MILSVIPIYEMYLIKWRCHVFVLVVFISGKRVPQMMYKQFILIYCYAKYGLAPKKI